MLFVAGCLHAEEKALRRVAQARINAALHALETQIARLSQAVQHQLTLRRTATTAPAQWFALILRQPSVTRALTTIERYTQAFPELRERAERARVGIIDRARRRLTQALALWQEQRRFRYTKGLRSH